MSVTFEQHDAALGGTLDVTGSACLTHHAIEGTVLQMTVSFAVNESKAQGSWTGTLTGDELKGEMVVTCAGVGTGTGTFDLHRGA